MAAVKSCFARSAGEILLMWDGASILQLYDAPLVCMRSLYMKYNETKIHMDKLEINNEIM